MPTLSIFFGIVIRIWHDDHPPPHIHVEYQGFEALVDIASGDVRDGSLPRKVAAIVNGNWGQISIIFGSLSCCSGVNFLF